MAHNIENDETGETVYTPTSTGDCDRWFDENDPGYREHTHTDVHESTYKQIVMDAFANTKAAFA